MSKFYFTYGTAPQFPYRNGWTEVETPSMEVAIEMFKYFHPNRPGSGCVNCAFYYTAERFETPDNVMLTGEFGDRCHERIFLAREILDDDAEDLADIKEALLKQEGQWEETNEEAEHD